MKRDTWKVTLWSEDTDTGECEFILEGYYTVGNPINAYRRAFKDAMRTRYWTGSLDWDAIRVSDNLHMGWDNAKDVR